MKNTCSNIEKFMPKFINERLFVKSVISAAFSSVVGTLLFLIYLAWTKDDRFSIDLWSFVFVYLFVAATSTTGTLVGSLFVGMPVVAIAERFYP